MKKLFAIIEKYGVDPLEMVFNGPFQIKEYTKSSKIVFEKNPTYWDVDKVKLQKIDVIYVEEEASRHRCSRQNSLI